MPGTNHHTWHQVHIGHVLITALLDSPAAGQKVERHQALADLTRRLVQIAESHRLPITWAVNDPAHSAATSLILQSAVDHELAILGDANWVGPTAGRTRFARELIRRRSQSRATGVNVTSLVPQVASIEQHIDLVVKQKITAVAGFQLPDSGWQLEPPRALHYGVWELPISARLPFETQPIFGGKWAAWRRIRRAIREASTYHLIIDAPAIVDCGSLAEKTTAWVIRRIALLRDRGFVSVETMRSMAACLAHIPAAQPQRSILRAAA